MKMYIPTNSTQHFFSDYAHKARFVKLLEGKIADYHPTEVMEFPVGSILIKNFYYPNDFFKAKWSLEEFWKPDY